MDISRAYSEDFLNNSSTNININRTSCFADNEINDTFTRPVLWNETSAHDVNVEDSSADSLGDTATLNLGLAVPMGIIMYMLSLVTVVGNAMVLHAIRAERRLQTVSTKNNENVALLSVPYSVITTMNNYQDDSDLFILIHFAQ
jgi:hypothetical protein